MKKLTASLTLITLLFTGAALAAENAPAPEHKAPAGHKAPPDGPMYPKMGKKHFRFGECDTNKDGAVSYEEFQACASPEAKERFDAMDADKDGKVTREEFKAWREKMRMAQEEKRKERRTELFKKCDKDGNGSLSLDEFLACPPKPEKRKGPESRPPHNGERPAKPGMMEKTNS